jgi:hypothetical protein
MPNVLCLSRSGSIENRGAVPERVAVWAEHRKVFKRIVGWVFVHMMHCEDFGMSVISAILAFFNHVAPFKSASHPIPRCDSQNSGVESALRAAKSCLVFLPLTNRELLSAQFANFNFWTLKLGVSHFPSTFGGAISLGNPTILAGFKFNTAKTTLLEFGWAVKAQVIRTLAFIGAKLSSFRPVFGDIELNSALLTEFQCAPPYRVFDSLWSSHDLNITQYRWGAL